MKLPKAAVILPAELTDQNTVRLKDSRKVFSLVLQLKKEYDCTLILRDYGRSYEEPVCAAGSRGAQSGEASAFQNVTILWDTAQPSKRSSLSRSGSFVQRNLLTWQDAPLLIPAAADGAPALELVILTDPLDFWGLSVLTRVSARHIRLRIPRALSPYLLKKDAGFLLPWYDRADTLILEDSSYKSDFAALFPSLADRCRVEEIPPDADLVRRDLRQILETTEASPAPVIPAAPGTSSAFVRHLVIPCRLTVRRELRELMDLAEANRSLPGTSFSLHWHIYVTETTEDRFDRLLYAIAVRDLGELMELDRIPGKPPEILLRADALIDLPESGDKELCDAAKALGVPVCRSTRQEELETLLHQLRESL